MMLSDTDFPRLLAGYEPATLAAWYADLNAFQWPDDFPIAKPLGYDALPQHSAVAPLDRYTALRPLMEALQAMTTPEDRSRAWWRHLGRADEAWAAWWDREGDAFHEEVRATRDTAHAEGRP
jgi:hypothetical protein